MLLSTGLSALHAEPPIELTATFVPPDEVQLSWPSIADQSYQLWSTTYLGGAWTTYSTDPAILVATGEELSVTVPVGDAVRFFRAVELEPEPPEVPGMVWIEPGTFTMGSSNSVMGHNPNEGPQTQVTLTQGFWLGRHEVTQAEYQTVRGVNPSLWMGDDMPVEQVSWDDAVAYCEQRTQQERDAGRLLEGWEYRLPTEAQWEYACRAGSTTRFGFGDSDSDLGWYAWYNNNSSGRPHPVGEKLPNAWGLYDMHGNVEEWCADGFSTYPGGSVTDPTGPVSSSYRMLRGGNFSHNALLCGSADRTYATPSSTGYRMGFRVALVPVP